MDDDSYLVSGPVAARIAGVSEAAVRQWATRGKIRRLPGRRRCDGTMYLRPEVEAEGARVAAARQRTAA